MENKRGFCNPLFPKFFLASGFVKSAKQISPALGGAQECSATLFANQICFLSPEKHDSEGLHKYSAGHNTISISFRRTGVAIN